MIISKLFPRHMQCDRPQVTAVVEGGFALMVDGNRMVVEPEEGIGLDFRALTP